MYRGVCFSLLLLSLPVSSALALSIHYGGIDSSMPFELAYQDVQTPLEIVLQIANDSDTTASVLAWQVDLPLRALGGAQGTLLFYDVAAPPDPLFDQTAEPQSEPELPPPSDRIFVQDGNMAEFEGEPVPQQSARNILLLTLVASPDAAGAFQLIMPTINDPEADSSWFDSNEFAPKAFDNSAPSEFPGYILLGTIHIGQTPKARPGDYNLDGEVNAADYDRWRANFGNTIGTPGKGADGNGDGVIDAADYVVWRTNMGTEGGTANGVAGANVPEPANLTLAIIALSCLVNVFHQWTRNTTWQWQRHLPKQAVGDDASVLA